MADTASCLSHCIITNKHAECGMPVQAKLCASFCPKLAQHLPVALTAGRISPAVRSALQDLNTAHLRFSLQAAQAALDLGQVRLPGACGGRHHAVQRAAC